MNTTPAVRAERILTELDHVRLSRCLQRSHAAQDDELTDVLELAHVVPVRDVPADIATMRSSLQIEELPGRTRRTLTLCYPEDADPAQGRVSVLSPVGRALIGLPVGAIAQWRTPGGTAVQARIVEITFQPEASGEYTR
jgi:regulator of nucleoside diphosphate kinase